MQDLSAVSVVAEEPSELLKREISNGLTRAYFGDFVMVKWEKESEAVRRLADSVLDLTLEELKYKDIEVIKFTNIRNKQEGEEIPDEKVIVSSRRLPAGLYVRDFTEKLEDVIRPDCSLRDCFDKWRLNLDLSMLNGRYAHELGRKELIECLEVNIPKVMNAQTIYANTITTESFKVPAPTDRAFEVFYLNNFIHGFPFKGGIVRGVSEPIVLAGPAGSTANFHVESGSFSSVNLQLKGKKLWIIIDRNCNDVFVKAVQRGAKSSCPGILGGKNYFASVPFLDNAGVTFKVKLQMPNELVLIEPCLFHAILNVEDSVSISSNFCSIRFFLNRERYFLCTCASRDHGGNELEVDEQKLLDYFKRNGEGEISMRWKEKQYQRYRLERRKLHVGKLDIYKYLMRIKEKNEVKLILCLCNCRN